MNFETVKLTYKEFNGTMWLRYWKYLYVSKPNDAIDWIGKMKRHSNVRPCSISVDIGGTKIFYKSAPTWEKAEDVFHEVMKKFGC